MDFILYVDNYPREILFWEKDILDFFKQTSSMQNLSTLRELLEQKVILQRDFEDLRKNLELVKETAALESFRWIEESISDYLESAEDCMYLRRKEVDLEFFLHETIERWQVGWLEDDYEESAVQVIQKAFHHIEDFYGFDLPDKSNSRNISSAVHKGVEGYWWGRRCWESVELDINDMNPFYRSEMDLQELMEMLYWSCVENC